jgi:hypothetical protein
MTSRLVNQGRSQTVTPRATLVTQTHPMPATRSSLGKLLSNLPFLRSHVPPFPNSLSNLSRTSLSQPCPPILQPSNPSMGGRADAFIFPILKWTNPDQASTNNIHSMPHICHHTRTSQRFGRTLPHADVPSCFLHQVNGQTPADPSPAHPFTYDLSFPFVMTGGQIRRLGIRFSISTHDDLFSLRPVGTVAVPHLSFRRSLPTRCGPHPSKGSSLGTEVVS